MRKRIGERLRKLLWKLAKRKIPCDRTLEYWETAAKLNPHEAIYPDKTRSQFETEKSSIVFRPEIKLTSDMTVLDLGCGIGRVGKWVAPQVRKYIGVDFSPTMIKKAQERCRHLANARFIVNDGWTLKKVAANSVDLVFCGLVFQHISKANTRAYIDEVFRVIRPNGVFISQIARWDHYRDEAYAFTKEEVADLFQNWRVVDYLRLDFNYAYYEVRAVK